MSTMSTLLFFACGIIVGELMDMVYDRLNDQNIEGDSALLHWLEHYHWGLILFFLYGFPDAYALEGVPWLISSVSSPFHLGFGLSLILDESRGETRFAWKKGVQTPWYHFYESTVIGVMITLILLLRWLTVPLSLLVPVILIALVIAAAAILVGRRRRSGIQRRLTEFV
jgi:hypothetical protein